MQQFFQKCCRGVGEQPTFAKQIAFLQFGFPVAITFSESIASKDEPQAN